MACEGQVFFTFLFKSGDVVRPFSILNASASVGGLISHAVNSPKHKRPPPSFCDEKLSFKESLDLDGTTNSLCAALRIVVWN